MRVTDFVDPRILGPDLAPTPFTAEEIRAGCPSGRMIRLQVEVDGRNPMLRMNRFVDADADGATLESRDITLDGEPVGPTASSRVTWAELQAHASFPADHTEIVPETIDTPLGTLDCLRYTVRDGTEVNTFWFARSLPGMPIRYTAEAAGRMLSVVTMVATT